MSQVVILGLDGADFGVFEREIDAGNMPAFKQLLQQAVTAPLLSTVPPLTFPAWASFATGMNPGRHGIFDFSEKEPGTYEIRFVNSTWVKSPAFWQYCGRQGGRVCVLGVPLTYPPEHVNGILISGFDAPGVGGGKLSRDSVYPAEFFDIFMREFPDYWLGANVVGLGMDYEKIGQRILDVLKTRLDAILWLYKREKWDCFVAVVGETDAVCHYFWRFYDRLSPFYDPQKAILGRFISKVYGLVDNFLNEFMDILHDDATVIFVSDHGMGPVGNTMLRLNSLLAEAGFLKFKTNNTIAKTLELVKKIGLRYVPPAVKRAIFRHTDIVNRIEGHLRFAGFDWARTLVYSEESPQFPSLRFNLKNREPEGALEEQDRYRVGCEVKNLLKELKAEDGTPVVRQVYLREEIYAGRYVEKAPDILIEWNYDLPSGPPLFLRSQPDSLSLAKADKLSEEFLLNRSACHRPEGIFVASGRKVKNAVSALKFKPSLTDIAPTVLSLLECREVPVFDGRPLKEVFDMDVRSVNREGEDAAVYKREQMSEEQEEEIKKKLRSLGYL